MELTVGHDDDGHRTASQMIEPGTSIMVAKPVAHWATATLHSDRIGGLEGLERRRTNKPFYFARGRT